MKYYYYANTSNGFYLYYIFTENISYTNKTSIYKYRVLFMRTSNTEIWKKRNYCFYIDQSNITKEYNTFDEVLIDFPELILL